MEIVILARTKMHGNYVCIGGFNKLEELNVRLLNPDGNYFTSDAEFDVGQVWDVEYYMWPYTEPPHVEDVWLSSAMRLEKLYDTKSFVAENCQVVRGSLSRTFDKNLHRSNNGAIYIGKEAISSCSVCIWECDHDLKLVEKESQRARYFYPQSKDGCFIPYVGWERPDSFVPKGTLVRLSLARWWKPCGTFGEARCYLQISGFFK